jgi:DNA (cytosine-5)-methyltransferase 1
VFCGGFPCTDISVAGKHAGGIDGKQSGLWYEYKRLIREYKPRIAIIENVSGLLGRGLARVLQDLAEIGYDATWTMFDSKYFGVPQRRRRLYIVAVRDGIPPDSNLFQLEERHTKACRESVGLIDNSGEWLLQQGEEEWSQLAYFTKQSHGEYSEKGVSGTILKRDTADLILDCGRLRRVMPKERMRLQGFPEDWLIESSQINMFTASGMTVPVVKHIGERIIHEDF